MAQQPQPALQRLSQLRPLPEEILRMSETETACQYCGISYLLLSKYERMEQHVREVDAEMAQLKKYIEERPQMLKRLESLLSLQKRLEDDREIAETAMRDWQSRYRKEADQVEHLSGQGQNLKKELDLTNKTIHTLETQAQMRASANSRSITNMQCEIIHIQNEVARLKGNIKSSVAASVLEAVVSASKQVASHVSAHQQRVVRAAVERADTKSQAVISALHKEVESLKESLEDSQRRNERLSNELTAYRRDFSSHVEGQKSYIQSIQTNCAALEERLHQANRDIMDLSTNRERIYVEKTQLQKTYDTLKQDYDNIREDYDRKVLDLQTQMSRENMEHKLQIDQLEAALQEKAAVAQSQSGSAVAQAHQALAKKDEQLMQMERTIRELNSNLAMMRTERVKTIEAHQNRIKQLQERFLEDLKSAGKDEASRVEAELRRVFAEDKDEALCQQRQLMQQEFEEARQKLLRQIDALKAAADQSNRESQKRANEEWKARQSELEDQIARLQSLNAADNDRYQSKIREMESELSDLRNRLFSQDPNMDRDKIVQLTAKLEKRDAEISFLKETVRLECEERMGLVAMVTKFKQQSQIQTQQTQKPVDGDAQPQNKQSVRVRSGTPLSATGAPAGTKSPRIGGMARLRPHSSGGRDANGGSVRMPAIGPQGNSSQHPTHPIGIPSEMRTFEMLINAATAKKERKLAKQNSLRRVV